MDLIFGGAHQGKWAYAKACCVEQGSRYWDGRELFGILTYPEDCAHLVVNRFHHYCHHLLEEGFDLEESLAHFLASARGKALLIVMDEQGSSLVPVDPRQRAQREIVGRCLQHLAGEAERVVRVMAGCPLLLKGELPCR